MSLMQDNHQEIHLTQTKTMAADFETEKHDVSVFDMGSIQCSWSGVSVSLTSKAKIIPQASVDGVNWCGIYPDTAIKKVDVASGCCMYLLPSIEFRYLRVKFEKNSNSGGTIDIISFVKRRRSNNP